MNVSEPRKRHWHHLSGCIQFHCTRTQWNHTVAQREILGLEPVDISEQLVLGMVPIRIEYR